jgi:hypothetical protein
MHGSRVVLLGSWVVSVMMSLVALFMMLYSGMSRVSMLPGTGGCGTMVVSRPTVVS